jgi:drug/metabolite transporter (DMT)-like permease
MGVIAALLITSAIIAPGMNDEPMGICLGLIAGIAMARFWHSDNAVARDIRAKSPWIFGPLAILFGPAMILPALAKIKQQHAPVVEVLGPMLIGVIILVTGFVLVGFGIRRRMRTA